MSKVWKKIKTVVAVVVAVLIAIHLPGFVAGWGKFWGTAAVGTTGTSLSLAGGAVVGAAAGFAAGAILTGSLDGALKGAVSGAVGGFFGAAAGSIGGHLQAPKFISRAIGSGFSSRVNGGRFKDGFGASLLMSGVQKVSYKLHEYYKNEVGYEADASPGKNTKVNNYVENKITGRLEVKDIGKNIIGLNSKIDPLNPKFLDFLRQGGALSKALNLIPTMNATAGLHDFWFNDPNGFMPFNPFTNVGSMLPAAIISVGAVAGGYTQVWEASTVVYSSVGEET